MVESSQETGSEAENERQATGKALTVGNLGNPLGYWHRLSWRWKMTLVGTGMGAFASSLSTTPAAYLALSNGYIGHGIGYVIVTAIGIVGMAGLMHFFGIRQERDLNGAE